MSVVLIVLDGWGYSPNTKGNAIALAEKPTIDRLYAEFPSGLLQASGVSVGLPWGQSGNSEVGHMALGTGQIRYQPLVKISNSIREGSFFQNQILKDLAGHVRKNSSALHLAGLFGSGSVHSWLDHLWALIEFAQQEKLTTFIHLFTDGRDSPPKAGAALLKEFLLKLDRFPNARLATVIGRYYAMDRDHRWERTQTAFDLLLKGKGNITQDPVASINASYLKGLNDEYTEPLVIEQSSAGRPVTVQGGDAVVFFNFREDSARQLVAAFTQNEDLGFNAEPPRNLAIATITSYDPKFNVEVIFPPEPPKGSLSKIVADHNKSQFTIAETEKYAHVTYFLNGGNEEPAKSETRKMIGSHNVENFTLSPQMRASEISKDVVEAIRSGKYDFIVANFANADMLGHTGNLGAAIQGVEAIDQALKPIIETVLQTNSTLLLTADHGNAENMLHPRTGEILTEHTTNPVPFWIVSKNYIGRKSSNKEESPSGILQDVAATTLDLLGITIPEYMDGKSLLRQIS